MLPKRAKSLLIISVISFFMLSLAQVAVGKNVPPQKNHKLYYNLQGELVCLCGCGGLLIKDCFCGNADKIREFLTIQIDAGRTEKQIKATMVQLHGEKVLAEPISPTAKILIAIAVIAGLGFVVFILSKWRKNKTDQGDEEEDLSEEEIEYDSRIDEDLHNLDS